VEPTKYYQLELSNIPLYLEEVLSLALFELGAAGIQENLEYVQEDKRYLPKILEKDKISLLTYFTEPPSREAIELALGAFPGVSWKISDHLIEDWMEHWKESWRPFELIENVWVVPSWHKASFVSKQGHLTLWIDPGMAFGTGTHETTQIAAELLFNLLSQKSGVALLDVGTGSGILAILAYLLKAEPIYAYDNDPESHRVFLENCERNSVPPLPWVEKWSDSLAGKVQVTVANIIDGVLCDLKDDFQKMKSQTYIFTGILKEREPVFLQEMLEGWNLKQVRRLEKGEWVGFQFEAP